MMCITLAVILALSRRLTIQLKASVFADVAENVAEDAGEWVVSCTTIGSGCSTATIGIFIQGVQDAVDRAAAASVGVRATI